MNASALAPVMNDTKWDELRMGMYTLGDLIPQWRAKDFENGFITRWDGEWFYHFRDAGFASIEWVEIRTTSPKQDVAVHSVLRSVHVPGMKIEGGYKVFGYVKSGQQVDYIK